MKRIFVLLALATLVTGLLGSCKKDDIENPDPQSFEEVVKNLPGVYLTADYYDEFGFGRVVNLKEDGTTEQYYFFDNEVEDGVSVNEGYVMKGTWTAFKVDDISSKTGFICKLSIEGDPEAEAIADTNYVAFNNDKTYIFSSYFGLDEFFKVNQTFDEFRSDKNLEAFLPGHLKDTELAKFSKSTNEANAYATPPESLSHWMRDIPDNVHLIDLSIPGSHDALSYRCMPYAMTQTESIEKQFMWGSRYFDFRCYHAVFGGSKVYPCHDDHRCVNLCWTILNEIDKLITYVTACRSETAIIRFRLEGPNQNADDRKFCHDWINANLLLYNAQFNNIFVPYRPDLTLGETRGKIVIMSDDPKWREDSWYIDTDPDGQFGRTPEGEVIRNGGHKYTTQDLCKLPVHSIQEGPYLERKVSAFEQELRKNRKEIPIGSKVSNTPYNECLSFNHCSGYIEKYCPVQFSHFVYPEITNVMRKKEYERKTYGIVPMDYIGREDAIFEEYSAWQGIKNTFDFQYTYQDYWTVNTRDLIEQIVRSNDIFKN